MNNSEASTSNGKANLAEQLEGKVPEGSKVLFVGHADGGKDGQHRQGRRRYVIIVDEEEERTRWVPWVLLAALIVGVGVATYFIIAYVVNSRDETPTEIVAGAKPVNPGDGRELPYQSCSALISRVRDAALETIVAGPPLLSARYSLWDQNEPNESLPWVNRSSIALTNTATEGMLHDIIVPPTRDTKVIGDFQGSSAHSDGLVYAAAGTELLVLSGLENATRVVQRYDFANNISAFQYKATLEVSPLDDTGGGPGTIPYGLGNSFRANQVLTPAGNPNILLVIGSSVSAVPVSPGPSPVLAFGGHKFTNPSQRPFDSTVIIRIDISQVSVTNSIKVLGITEHEGRFVTAASDAEYAWVFIRASAHLPSTHKQDQDEQLGSDDIMPQYRDISIDSDLELEAWRSVGTCEDVKYLQLGDSGSSQPDADRTEDSYLLVSVPIPLLENVTDEFMEEDAQVKNGQNLFALGWTAQIQPLLVTPTAEEGNLQVFLAEAIRTTASSSPSNPAAASGTGPVEDSSAIQTAIVKFNLTDGDMMYDSFVTVNGELVADGAMHYLENAKQLSVLSTESSDDSTFDSVVSRLSVFNTFNASQLDLVYNRTGQFRERLPTSIVYPSDDIAFIGFAYVQRPLVQVLRTSNSGAGQQEDDVAVQRLSSDEHVSLMKGFRLPTEEAEVEMLLVAGRNVEGGATGPSTAAAPAPAPSPVSDDSRLGQLQFSIYYFSPDTSSIQPLGTMNVSDGRVASEAFRDSRASLLFDAPDVAESDDTRRSESRTFFALPVALDSSSPLLDELGCTGTGTWSGTLIWKINITAADAKEGEFPAVAVSIHPLAAVPSGGPCGGGTSTDPSLVKRLRLYIDESGTLKFSSISSCHVDTVPWEDIVAPMTLAPVPQAQLNQTTGLNTTTNGTVPSPEVAPAGAANDAESFKVVPPATSGKVFLTGCAPEVTA